MRMTVAMQWGIKFPEASTSATSAKGDVSMLAATSDPSRYILPSGEVCHRAPLRSHSYYNGTRTFDRFDDTLLIVFWNKPYVR